MNETILASLIGQMLQSLGFSFDELSLYTISFALFLGLGITLTNLFYSNPALSAIPEGYTPKEWEYHPNPITRYVYNGGHNNDWCLTYIGNTMTT